jgi:fibronectin-binding autotransporter adhesin
MTKPEPRGLYARKNNRSATPTFLWQTTLLLVAIGIASSSAQAQDATWKVTPGSGDYNTPTNWTPTAAPIGPAGTASFGASGTTSLTFSTGTTVDTFQFNSGAPAYTFGLNGHFLEFTGTGIVNNSANAPTINAVGLLQFDNTATAGNAIINNTPGSTTFTGSSTAGTATITNSGGGLLSFTDFSTAGNATITTNAGSLTQFFANSDGGNARFVTNGSGIVDFSGTTGTDGVNIINTGSIAGSGRYFLGGNIVHVGGNGDTTTVSGVISACGPTGNECTAASGTSGGALFKDGAGTLTLSGVNTYTGATIVNGGTLQIAGAGTLGAATVQVQMLAGTLNLGGTTQTTGDLTTFGGSIVNGALNSTAYTLGGGFISARLTGGAVTQDGAGTTTLAATNTYTGGTIINSGTLEAAHVSGGAIDALSSGGITINSLGALRSSVNGTLGNTITFNDSSTGTLSAAAGTTLTLTGGIFLNPDSITTFGTPTDTGTVLMNPLGISPSTTASVVVGGGILRAGSNQLAGALGVTQSTTVNAGATLDFADFTAAVHNLQGAGSVMTGALAATTLSLSVDAATTSEFSGVISGAGKVSVSGSGTMILSGSNTYGNGTVIGGASTLQIGNGGTTGSILGDVANGGTLIFNRSDAYTFTGAITGSGDNIGNVVQNGTGTTILTAANTYTGTTTINAGTLQLGNGGTTGSIPGNVLNNGTFAINHSDAFAFGGVISGTGAFQQLGAGTTTLTAVQTYQGLTTISAGVLALTGTASIAASSGVVADAKFDISGLLAGTSITNLTGGSAGTVALGNNTLTLTNAAGTFAGVISGGGGLIKQGSGLFTLTGANNYTGATTVAGGNLRVNGSVASAVTVQSGATLSGSGSVGGLVTVQSGGTLSAGQSPGTITLGALNLNAGSTSVFELGSPGVVGGATNDLVNVTGNLTLGGTLSVNAPSAGYYRLFNYGTLTPSNFDTISGSSNGTPVVLTNVPNQVNLSIAAAGQRIQFWDGADQTGNGVVNGGTGTWNATNTNWTGAPGQANINDQWRSSVGVFAGTAGTVTIAGAQAFDTLQFSTTGYVLNAGAGGQLQLAGLSSTGTINTDGGVVATINAPIVNGSSQSLAKVGGGTLILTAANTYTGGTTISAGTLQLGNGGTTGSVVGNIVDNGTLAVNRSNAVTLSGVISGTGAFQQIGQGTTTLTNTNTYTGPTTVTSGFLTISATGSITSNVTNNVFATFTNAGTVTGSLFTTGTASNSGTITGGLTTTSFEPFAPNTMTNTGTINGGATVSGRSTLNTNAATSIVNGGLTNSATVNARNQVNGAIVNQGGGRFIVAGNLTGNDSFTNSGNAQLDLNGGNFTGITTLTNNSTSEQGIRIPLIRTLSTTGAVTNAAGATILVSGRFIPGQLLTNSGDIRVNIDGGLIATAGITNTATGTITVALGGGIEDDLNNAGVVTNNGAFNGVVATNTGSITNIRIQPGNDSGNWTGDVLSNAGAINNRGIWIGNVVSNTGTINNNLTWTGAVSNAGTFNNNAGATVSGLLTNTAGTTTNNGALNGGANVSGGTLNTDTATSIVNGGLTNTATVNAAGAVNGAIANNAGGTFNVTGALSSNSTFTNAAGATLAVSTATYILQGLLTNSGAVTVANGATLNATTGGVTNNASGTITVAVGGTVKDDLNNAGVTTNNGAYLANVATNTGTITNNGVWTGNVLSNAGTINNNLTWTGTVSNAGTFNNNAGATVSGLLTNTAGTTTNNGALNGGANVSGGTLAGSGTVTNLNVSGGTFAPGNGTPGTSMTVTGNLAFQSGAMYLVTLNPTTASFASVGGTASLNGTAAALYLAGNYISKKYTILTAAGGVSGTFGSLVNTNVPANFTSTLSYDANNAYINLTLNFIPNPAPNFGSGLNINQQNVANTLVNFFNTTGGIPLAFGTLTPAGLTVASGELGTGVIQSSIKANDMFLNLLLDPSVAGRAGGFASGGGAPSQFATVDEEPLAYAAKRKATSAERDAYAMATKAPYLAPQPVNRWSVWGAAYGGSATVNGDAAVGSHDTTASAYGVVGGADYKISPDALIGFALAGGGTRFAVASALGNGNSDLFQAGVFGRQNIGAAYLSAALAYGWQDVTTNRTVALAGADVLQGRFRAETFSGRFEGGYRFATPLAGITPYVAAQVISFNLPAYTEQALAGAGTFALNYAGQTTTASRTELGLRSDKSFAVQDGIFTLRGRAAWAHDYNNDRAVTAIFQTLPGASFVVNGARANPDGALVSAGAEMKWINGVSLAATFEGEFSGNTTSYAGKGVARYTW